MKLLKSGVSGTVFRFLRGDNVRLNLENQSLKPWIELGYYKKSLLQNLVIEISVAKDFEKV